MMKHGSHLGETTHRYHPLTTLLPAAVCLLLILNACALPVRPASRGEEGIPVRFIYVDAKARQVCLAGSFNEWSASSYCLARSADTWSIDVSLPPGRYQYLFVIDEESWREDPGALLSEETGFGSRNSILVVE